MWGSVLWVICARSRRQSARVRQLRPSRQSFIARAVLPPFFLSPPQTKGGLCFLASRDPCAAADLSFRSGLHLVEAVAHARSQRNHSHPVGKPHFSPLFPSPLAPREHATNFRLRWDLYSKKEFRESTVSAFRNIPTPRRILIPLLSESYLRPPHLFITITLLTRRALSTPSFPIPLSFPEGFRVLLTITVCFLRPFGGEVSLLVRKRYPSAPLRSRKSFNCHSPPLSIPGGFLGAKFKFFFLFGQRAHDSRLICFHQLALHLPPAGTI